MSEELKLDQALVENLSKRETDIKEHLWTLYNLVAQMGARVVVELGAGQSTYVLAAAVRETSGRLWSVDRNPEAHLRGFPEGKGLLEAEPRVSLVQGDDLVVAETWEMVIDFLFIDTSHTYQHTLDELIIWGHFVRVGGKIAMHDTFHKFGHAVDCRRALDRFLEDNPGKFEARHIENCGGLSILTKLDK